MKTFFLLLVISLTAFGESSSWNVIPNQAKGIQFEQKLGASLPLNTEFRDHEGKPVKLGDYFKKGPVILAMAYYECPNICTVVFRETFQTLQRVKFDQAGAYQLVFVSINPKEGPELAKKKRRNYLNSYKRSDLEAHTAFLTGDETQITQVAQAIGFSYRYDSGTKQYIHPSGIVVATPDGRVSRYLYGIRYDPRDLRLSLIEASGNKIGSRVDHLLLFCFKYDPEQGKYGFMIMGALRVAGGITATVLGGYIFAMLRRERRKRKKEDDSVRKV